MSAVWQVLAGWDGVKISFYVKFNNKCTRVPKKGAKGIFLCQITKTKNFQYHIGNYTFFSAI
jgi:hypothetical protein